MKQFTHIGIREAYAQKHRPECVRVLADFYWRVLLSLAVVIVLIFIVYGIRQAYSVIGGDAAAQVPGVMQPVPKLNKTKLQDTLTAFGAREVRFNALKTAPQKIADPSR